MRALPSYQDTERHHSAHGGCTAPDLAQAHAPELFACGVAKSGAYNRTLTPFGFQAEERTLWQATDVYMQMSPFLNVSQSPHMSHVPASLLFQMDEGEGDGENSRRW